LFCFVLFYFCISNSCPTQDTLWLHNAFQSQRTSKGWSIWNTVVESYKEGHAKKSLETGLSHQEKFWYNCRGRQSHGLPWKDAP
jgi:hypothetical protein